MGVALATGLKLPCGSPTISLTVVHQHQNFVAATSSKGQMDNWPIFWAKPFGGNLIVTT
jgi:hypothetical protein